MSYTFLLDQGEESSAECFSAIPASVLLRLNLTVGECCSNASETESCPGSQSGTTCEPSMAARGVVGLKSSREGSRARTLARQIQKELESAVQKAGYGGKCGESFARLDQSTSSWKTLQLSLLEGLEEFSQTWPLWGQVCHGAAFQL